MTRHVALLLALFAHGSAQAAEVAIRVDTAHPGPAISRYVYAQSMVLTPTYHLFKMYVPFQDATSLPVSYVELPDYAFAAYRVPFVSATAARGTDGRLYASVANLHPREAAEVSLAVTGAAAGNASAQALTADAIDSHNTFASPRTVQPKPFDHVAADGDTLTFTLPAKAIVMIAIDAKRE